MRVVRDARELAESAAALGRSSGLGGVLVPTMGALHEGHAALIRRGAELAQSRGGLAGCVVSIFVNPTQFNDPADFANYPRTLDADLAVCESAGARLVFAPSPETIYPGTSAADPPPPLPPVATEPGLEDRSRPGHFAGVCRVVLRLFRLLEPAAAIFGEKDWQQLQVVHAMTAAMALPIEIVSHPTVREPDGLAMSSRNRFLSAAERTRAAAIARALRDAGVERSVAAAERTMRAALDDAGLRTEYAVVREARCLMPIAGGLPPPDGGRALIAAWAGGTRLIDNMPWPA